MPERPFAKRFPAPTMAIFFGGIFALFAPLGVLMVTEFANPPSLLGWVVIGTFSGFTAVGWALVGTWTWKFVFVVGPTQFLWPLLFSKFAGPMYRGQGPSPSFDAWAVVILAVLAYIIFIWFIRKEGIRSLRIETEIALAQRIHEDQVPPIDVTTETLEIAGRSVASTEMGGDLIDVIRRDGVTDVILADVTGHGVRAGIIMTMLKSAVRTRLRTGGELRDMARDINDVFTELTDPGMFATFALLRFTESGASLINAGHLPVLQRRAGGPVISHDSNAMPMGVVEGETFEPIRIDARPGDTFLISTDGLTEARNAKGEMAGTVLIDEAIASGDAPAPMVDRLLERAEAWGQADDDRSAIAVRIRTRAPSA
ncbi:MAG: PP2C family protein-serine/threonine phosphatase [Phycisphaerales bacterium]